MTNKVLLPSLDKYAAKAKSLVLLAPRSNIHTARWANSLAERGYQVTLCSMHDGGPYLSKDVDYRRLSFNPPHGYLLNKYELKKILWEKQPDLLHVHYASGYGTLGALTGFQPRILSVWGSDIYAFPAKSPLHRLLIQNHLRSYRWICSTSWDMAEKTKEIASGTADKMTVTPFGVHIEKFAGQRVKENTITVGTIKTLSDTYGIDTLIRGFAKAYGRLQMTNLRLLLIGDGPHTKKYRQLVDSLGLSEVVTFQGRIDHELVPHYLAQIDLFVAVSRSESFGVAVIEASAAGIPVLVSSVGGLPEVVVDGQTGYVIAPDQPEALAQKIVELVPDGPKRRLLGEAGRKFVTESYRWDRCVELMEDVYANVVAKQDR